MPATKKKTDVEIIDGRTGEVKKSGKKLVHTIDQTPGTKAHKKEMVKYDALKKRLRDSGKAIGEQYHEMGQVLKQIRDERLYRLDKIESFDEFIRTENNMTRQTAYNLIMIAEALTAEQVQKYGVSMSYVLARAPGEAARKELESLLYKGASRREWKKKVSEQKIEAGLLSPKKKKNKTSNDGMVSRAVRTGSSYAMDKVKVSKKDLRKAREERIKKVHPFVGESGKARIKCSGKKREAVLDLGGEIRIKLIVTQTEIRWDIEAIEV
jgi:hypothetical protein